MGKMGFAAAIAALMCISACGGGGGGGDTSTSPPAPQAPNQAPIAQAGNDFSTSVAAQGVEIDGTQSSDPDGDALTFEWSITSEPGGAGASLASADQAKPNLMTLAPGEYTVELKVSDPAGASSYDSVIITLTNEPPVPLVEVTADMPAVGEEVILNATGTSDPNGQPLTYTWTVEQSPPGSLIRSSFDSAALPIEFDVEGDYVFSLEVSDGYTEVTQDVPTITVTKFSIREMDTPFRYASFQAAGGRMVTVRESELAILDGNGVEEARLTLPAVGRSVGISPNGQLAAVGHADLITFVDLNAQGILATHSVNADVGDVIMADDGYAYVFPASDQWVKVVSVSVEDGSTASSTGLLLRAGTHAKIHPSGTKAYGANNGSSPSDIERYDFAGGTSTVSYDSPYHGDFSFCGNLWIAADGASILTRCGVVVRATDNQSTDMTYVQQLQGLNGTVSQASYNAYSDKWYVIDQGSTVKVFDGQSGILERSITLPRSEGVVGNQLFPMFVVASQTEDSVLILSQDHETNPQHYYAVRSSAPDTGALDLPPELVVQKYTAGYTAKQMTIDAGASYDPEGFPLTYEWTLVSEPDGSAIIPTGMTGPKVRFSPVIEGDYVFEVTASDGIRQSETKTVTAYASSGNGLTTYRIEGAVSDAEYSQSLNVLAYITNEEPVLHLLNFDDFSEKLIPLPRKAYRVGIDPDGQFAAVSHAGLVSLVDLSNQTVTDTQEYSADWGDIVLDRNRRAHLVPNRDQWVQFVSIDFAANAVSQGLGASAGTQIRLHPNGVWVYGADRGLSPSDFEKWDVSTFPPTWKGESPYHGDYNIGGNIWISENGDDLLVPGGAIFNSSEDPNVDMTYLDELPEGVSVRWAAHTAAFESWYVIVGSSAANPSLNGLLVIFEDATFARTGMYLSNDQPIGTGSVPTTAERVFLSHTGRTKFVLTNAGNTLVDPYAIRVHGFE